MRLLIAEDDALLRAGLELLLRGEGFDVVGSWDNADDLLAAFEPGGADGAVLDVRMPPTFTKGTFSAAATFRYLTVLIASSTTASSMDCAFTVRLSADAP